MRRTTPTRRGGLPSIGCRRELLPRPPAAPILQGYKSNDTTVGKLGELLRENPTGLLVLRDELVGLLASLHVKAVVPMTAARIEAEGCAR